MRRLLKGATLFLKIRRWVPFLFEYFRSHEVGIRKKMFYMSLIAGYFLLPFDFVPDWLGIFGIIDDAAILMWILQKMIKTAPDVLKHKYGI